MIEYTIGDLDNLIFMDNHSYSALADKTISELEELEIRTILICAKDDIKPKPSPSTPITVRIILRYITRGDISEDNQTHIINKVKKNYKQEKILDESISLKED